MRGKALAAEIGFRQLERLDLGAHGAVEHEDALGRGLAQGLEDFGAVGGADFELGHPLFLSLPSCPGSARASTTNSHAGKGVDGRAKPGHDIRGRHAATFSASTFACGRSPSRWQIA